MAALGLREFWDSLDNNQLRNVLLVQKQELARNLTDERDKYLYAASTTAIAEELNRRRSSKALHPEPLVINYSSDGIYNLNCIPVSRGMSRSLTFTEFAQCSADEFLVNRVAINNAVRSLNPNQPLAAVDFCADKICLRCIDMLTYPRPIRKFKKRVAFSDIRSLLAADIGIDDVESMVLLVRGKPVPMNESRNLRDLSFKDNQLVVVSKKLGTPGEIGGQSVERNKQFVGDLLFGHSLAEEPCTNTVAVLFNITQGHQLLARLIERRVLEKLLKLYAKDQQARASEAELMASLEREAKVRLEEGERKKRKKQKKKQRERRLKDQTAKSDDTSTQSSPTCANVSGEIPDTLSEQSQPQLQPSQEEQEDEQEQIKEQKEEQKEEVQDESNNDASQIDTTEAEAELAAMQCVSCGAEMQLSHWFCAQCGHRANESVSLEESTARRKPRRRRNKSRKDTDDAAASLTNTSITTSEMDRSLQQGAEISQTVAQSIIGALEAEATHPAINAPYDMLPPFSYDTLVTVQCAFLGNDFRRSRTDSQDSRIAEFLASGPRAPENRLPFFKQLG